MGNFKKLPTGLHVYSYKGVDGVVRFRVLTQKQFNDTYTMNVWWSKTKEILSKINIKTQS